MSKQLNEVLGWGQSVPSPTDIFDGIVHEGKYMRGKFEASRFVCPRCKGKETFICPDAILGERFLSCVAGECLKKNSDASKALLPFRILETAFKAQGEKN